MNFKTEHSRQNHIVQWSLLSNKRYADPFNDVEVSASFIDPDGEERIVPAFWQGVNSWCIRYSSHKLGRHMFTTTCSDKSNMDLDGRDGSLEVVRYRGNNPLMKHGHLRVSQNSKYLEHVDGTPFLWLGDTWWMGLTKRLRWPADFKLLTGDRVKKGFTVIQIVAGLYPDMPPFDQRGANEAGFPWEQGYSRVNPKYFDMVDRRIEWLALNGLLPCIVGSWGYFMEFAGEEAMKKHWRNLIARYSAYPLVWCVAGEAVMPFYVSPKDNDRRKLDEYIPKVRAAWTRVARYIRSVDPHHSPVTIHPTDCAHNMVDDISVIDVDMLQTGHSDVHSFAGTVRSLTASVARAPRMPVLVGEVTYEGIMGASWENVQRLMFWTSMLNGAAGHTYGANGIWQVNTRKRPFGPSPHGRSWVDTPWEDAYVLPGSKQVGLGKRLLERYDWWRFESHPEWVEPHWTQDDYFAPYAAGIPNEVRFIYVPWHGRGLWEGLRLTGIEQGTTYSATYVDPRTGNEYDAGLAKPDERGEWRPPSARMIQDWILILSKS